MKNSKKQPINWKLYFDKRILDRGYDYYSRELVSMNKVTGNRIQAKVFGGDTYDVIIENPGTNQMRLGCNCKYSMDGHLCKHMAAVLFEWSKRTDDKNQTNEVLTNPFGEDDPQNPTFFSIPVIAQDFAIRKSMLDKANKLLEEKSLYLESFNSALDTYNPDPNSSRIATSIGVCKTEKSHELIELAFNRKRVIHYQCEACQAQRRPGFYWGYYNNKKHEPCEHIVALMKLSDEHIRRFDPGDYSDRAGIIFMNTFGHSSAKTEAAPSEAGHYGNVCLKPRISQVNDDLELTFRIGNGGKMYVVKNLTGLFDSVENKSAEVLGKDCTIDFSKESFDKESAKLFEIISHEVKRARAIEKKMERKLTYSYGGTLETGRGIPFVGNVADTIFEMYEGKEIEGRVMNSKKQVSIPVGEGNPNIKMLIQTSYMEQNGEKHPVGIKVSGSIPHIVAGGKNRYFISNDRFGIIDAKSKDLLLPFEEVSVGLSGEFEFVIGKKNLSEFYYNVLSRLKEDKSFQITDMADLDGLLKPKAEFSFYLDEDDDYILCQSKVNYNQEQFAIKPLDLEDFSMQKVRDMNQEYKARNLIGKLFSGYSIKESSYYIENSDEVKYDFLCNGIDKLLSCGDVHSTDAFSGTKIRRTPVVSLGVALKSNLLDLSIQNSDLSNDELAELLQSYKLKKRFHKLKSGDFVDLERNESLEALLQILDNTGISVKAFTKGKMQIPAFRALYLEKMLEGHEEMVSSRDRHYRSLIRNFKTITDADYEPPEMLEQVLRPYQKYGLKWLKTLQNAGFGGILADDMGLGKTLQVISMLLADKEEGDQNDFAGTTGCSLVVCPASLVYNWIDEVARYAPQLSAVPVVGSKSQRSEILGNYEKYDLLVTSYDLLKRDVDLYEELEFKHQIIDEAQYIKNAGSAAAKSSKLIHAQHKFALTGTPIENRLSELWSIFDYLMPGFLYGYEKFRKEYELPISKSKDEERTKAIQSMIAPFVLRRKKSDVLKELPDKIEEVQVARFDKEQLKLYTAQAAKIKGMLASENADFGKEKIEILAELTRIRQICCDPGLIFEDYKGGSAKREACLDLIRSAIDGGHKLLVFSQFTSMLALLEADLKAEKIAYYILTGATKKEDRIEMVKAFNKDETPIFLISLKAGGTGLNLTGADIVIHYDPWWNKAAQDQATDRAHRIGQTKNVTVYQLIAKDTIEEKIVELQKNKSELADAVLSGENRSLGSMTKEELLELLEL